jgi:hypothetical protein
MHANSVVDDFPVRPWVAVGHCSWYHVIQLCVVPFLSCFSTSRSIFVPNRTPQHHRRTMAPSLGSLVLQHDDIAGGPAGN